MKNRNLSRRSAVAQLGLTALAACTLPLTATPTLGKKKNKIMISANENLSNRWKIPGKAPASITTTQTDILAAYYKSTASGRDIVLTHRVEIEDKKTVSIHVIKKVNPPVGNPGRVEPMLVLTVRNVGGNLLSQMTEFVSVAKNDKNDRKASSVRILHAPRNGTKSLIYVRDRVRVAFVPV